MRFTEHKFIAKLRRRREPRKGLSVWDVMLILGVLMLVTGGLPGFFAITAYWGGVQEHISNSILGTKYILAQPPGNPGDKAAGELAFMVAGAGVVIGAAGWLMGKRKASPEKSKPESGTVERRGEAGSPPSRG